MGGDEQRPSIRASQVHANLVALAQLGPDNERRVREAIAPATLHAMQEVISAAWLPVELDIELTEAIARILGAETNRAWSRDGMVRSLKGGMLGPMFQGAVRILGLRPSSIYKFAPSAWKAVYRDCGTLSVTHGAELRAELSVEGVPGVMTASRTYFEGIAGALEGVLTVCRVQGSVAVADIDRAARRVVLDATWA